MEGDGGRQVTYRVYGPNDFMGTWAMAYLRNEVVVQPSGLMEVNVINLSVN